MASAADAELGGKVLRTSLEEIGHPQMPTPKQTDKSTASGIINETVKQRRSKAIDMRFIRLGY